MSGRPLLFLDVDGVLNCIERHEEYPRFDCEGIPVFVPPGTAERVGRLAEAFEVVWATAWMGRAHSGLRQPLDLPDASWPYLKWTDLKLPAILKYAGERQWAWVDDDAEWELRRLGWPTNYVDGLVLYPDHKIGLTDEHVESLLAFAQERQPA